MSKIRYKLIIPIILIIGITCFSPDVMAHPAAALHMEYDEDTTTLSVYIIHGVTDPYYHFTGTIVVRINDTIVETKNYLNQSSVTIHHYFFNLSADDPHDHDIINVTAICSLGGEYSKEMVLGEVHHEDKGSFASAVPAVVLGSAITIGIFAIPYAFNRDHPEISKRKEERKEKKNEKKRKKMKGEK